MRKQSLGFRKHPATRSIARPVGGREGVPGGHRTKRPPGPIGEGNRLLCHPPKSSAGIFDRLSFPLCLGLNQLRTPGCAPAYLRLVFSFSAGVTLCLERRLSGLIDLPEFEQERLKQLIHLEGYPQEQPRRNGEFIGKGTSCSLGNPLLLLAADSSRFNTCCVFRVTQERE